MLDVGADRLLPCYLLVNSACTLGRAPLRGFAIQINTADLDPNGMNRLAHFATKSNAGLVKMGAETSKPSLTKARATTASAVWPVRFIDRAVRFCTLDCEAEFVFD